MLFATPTLKPGLRRKLAELEALRRRLAYQLRRPSRWTGTIRRLARAEAVSASTSVEGFAVSVQEAMDIVEGRPTDRPSPADRQAVACYQLAMNRVLSLADMVDFHWSEQLLLDLHYMACHFQPEASPGHYRRGAVWVQRSADEAYDAPSADEVPGLMRELVAWLEDGDLDQPPVVRAAMAHVYMVSIHPFRDGNGRLGRILQSLVLVREGLLGAEFTSIERYIGAHDRAYHQALADVQGSRYDPSRDVVPWLRFCLEAHLVQAHALERRLVEAYARNRFCEQLALERRYAERLVLPLDQALLGVPVRNEEYRSEADIDQATASLDLRRLVEDGFLKRRGGGRSTHYVAADALHDAWARERRQMVQDELARHRAQGA